MGGRSSPMVVMPLTLPSGFRSAAFEGMMPLANKAPTCPNISESRSFSKMGEVIGAAPRLAVRKQSTNSTGSRTKGWSCSHSITSRLNGTLGNAGRRSGSVKALNVARSPGATVAPSNACRADDNSPNWQRYKTRDALTSNSSTFLLLRLTLRRWGGLLLPVLSIWAGLQSMFVLRHRNDCG